ncbi:hypothetical protein CDL15_Pgr015966 [Punica granatum]|uniref:Glutaredoxin domain-containing protein n=1 Tax=Punica granatum TaxID=22663 RepID=A0A218XQ17_PUNGR|nr:hypothetical protein CDL15_Pgr015966 [Punica granatum]
MKGTQGGEPNISSQFSLTTLSPDLGASETGQKRLNSDPFRPKELELELAFNGGEVVDPMSYVVGIGAGISLYCRRAKAVFKELNQKPFVVELDQREDGSIIQAAMGERVKRHTVPQVFIDGKHIGGSDDTVDAYESGELATLLGIEVDYDEEDL